jgi:hypothetical protein
MYGLQRRSAGYLRTVSKHGCSRRGELSYRLCVYIKEPREITAEITVQDMSLLTKIQLLISQIRSRSTKQLNAS